MVWCAIDCGEIGGVAVFLSTASRSEGLADYDGSMQRVMVMDGNEWQCAGGGCG